MSGRYRDKGPASSSRRGYSTRSWDEDERYRDGEAYSVPPSSRRSHHDSHRGRGRDDFAHEHEHWEERGSSSSRYGGWSPQLPAQAHFLPPPPNFPQFPPFPPDFAPVPSGSGQALPVPPKSAQLPPRPRWVTRERDNRSVTQERDDRSVTPPPPRSPSPSYLAVAKQAPSRISAPSERRKLLILDLNGTLLHRSPHVPRPKHRHNTDERARDEQGNWLPRLRAVHPRPYMRAFRSYLFAPQTRDWLDVMVWSSAQPHSVGDMVDKCFGEDKDQLLAVWARDTLGLSNDHYHRKVQTVKDLYKPWSHFASRSSQAPSSPQSSTASSPRSPPESSSPSRLSNETASATPQTHSALTTLLLDDSPRKAELQPFNHVCIGEYSGERRAKDLESLQKEQEWKSAVEARQLLDARMADTQGSAAPDESPESLAPQDREDPVPDASLSAAADQSAPAAADVETSKKRKRKEKKLQKRAALLEQLEAGGKPDVSYDETLLAVIGVLDEIKSQANVAAWIRSGGLWGPFGPPVVRNPEAKSEADAKEDDTPPKDSTLSTFTVEAEAPAANSDGSDLSVKDTPAAEQDAQADSNDTGKTKQRRRKRQRMRDSSTGEQVSNVVELADVGNDEETAAAEPPIVGAQAESIEAPQKMWFEDEAVVEFWAARGRKALEELGIPVEHGIER
ncbi:hypothetical protein PYCCODRAFT_1481601 [Trametes coccinea BRFM310]|uniref:FCP1 homology domain-containing protein n=1 Tax=Trametes coccinea (strain BRFM310) TaxID=1353009 RepID=A0A1Y2I769_TRAC3|nr:hypothetical protein PYCCODRAFT_1481601 [Trametes coccinea BRFM310]